MEDKILKVGNTDVSQSTFLTNAANNVQNYVNSLPWSKKRKEAFMNAYSSLILSGISGATNETGEWELVTGPIDRESMGRKEKQMLGDAANYIYTLLNLSATPSQPETPAKPKYKYEGEKAFNNWVKNNPFGGAESFSMTKDWNVLDEERDELGRRKVAKRIATLKDYLEKFKETVNDDSFDFTDTPFKNSEEVRGKIDNAIKALTSEDGINTKTELDLDIISNLWALGINYRNWFDNGLGELSDHYDESTGRLLTWGEYYGNLKKLELLKVKQAELAKKEEENRLNYLSLNSPWRSYKSLYVKPGLTMKGWSDKDIATKVGKDLTAIVDKLNELSLKEGNLSNDETSFIWGAFRSMKIPKTQISKDEYDVLRMSPRYKNQPISRFSKIEGVDGFIWDNKAEKLLYTTAGSGEGNWLEDVKTDAELKAEKVEQAGERQLYENGHLNLQKEDYARMAAMGLDIAGVIAAYTGPETAGVGTIISGALGLTSAGTDMLADFWDDSVTGKLMWKNLGINLGLGVASLTGFGGAGKAGKWVKNIARWTPYFMSIPAIAGNKGVVDTLKKSPKDWNVTDLKNISLALRLATGAGRNVKSRVSNNRMTHAITTKKNGIKTTKGFVEATKEQVARINKIGKELGTAAANAEVRKLPGAAPDAELTVNFREGLTSGTRNKLPGVDKVKLETTRVLKPESIILPLRAQSEAWKAKYPRLSRIIDTNYDRILKTYGLQAADRASMSSRLSGYKPTAEASSTALKATSTALGTNTIPKALTNQTETNSTSNSNSKFTPEEIKALRESNRESKRILKSAKQEKPYRKGEDIITAETPLKVGSEYKFNTPKGEITFKINNKGELICDGTPEMLNGKPITIGGRNGNRQVSKRVVQRLNELERKILKDKSIETLKLKEYMLGKPNNLLELKKLGFLKKQGGRINTLDKIISDIINNN